MPRSSALHAPTPTTLPALAITLALTTTLFIFNTPAAAHERLATVIASGDGLALASICTDRGYFLMLTARPETQPWTVDHLQAGTASDNISIALRYEDNAEGNTRILSRTENIPQTWNIPNGRSYTSTLLIIRARADLHLRLWLPDDEQSGPGRHIPISKSTIAQMYLNAIQC